MANHGAGHLFQPANPAAQEFILITTQETLPGSVVLGCIVTMEITQLCMEANISKRPA